MVTIELTDSPALVRAKREFARLCEREELLTELITLRAGNVPAHYVARDRVRTTKQRLAGQIDNLQRLKP